MAKRTYRIVHEPYLLSYLQATFPPGTWAINVRIGEPPEHLKKLVPPGRLRGMLKLWMGSVDAIVLLPEKTILIETYIRNQFGKIEQLLYYKELFLTDTKYKDRWELPIELLIVTPIDNPPYRKFAEKYGVKTVLWRPEGVEAYLKILRPREREGHRKAFPFK